MNQAKKKIFLQICFENSPKKIRHQHTPEILFKLKKNFILKIKNLNLKSTNIETNEWDNELHYRWLWLLEKWLQDDDYFENFDHLRHFKQQQQQKLNSV